MGKEITLSQEDASYLLGFVVGAIGTDVGDKVTHDRKRLWRVFMRLDKAAGDAASGLATEGTFPGWVRRLLHQTYAPDHVGRPKGKAKAPKGSTRGLPTSSKASGSLRSPRTPRAPKQPAAMPSLPSLPTPTDLVTPAAAADPD